MGTHMSAYIEVDHGLQVMPFSDPIQVYSLTEGSFVLDKRYDVFDALAGGRRDVMPQDDDPSRSPLIARRGMPQPCSLSVGWNYFFVVCDKSHLPDRNFWPESRSVAPDVAAEWLREKGSHETTFVQWFNVGGPGELVWRVVSEPGLHNATWLYLDEFDQSLRHHGLDLTELPIEYRVIRTALSQLANEFGRERVRLVIWFS